MKPITWLTFAIAAVGFWAGIQAFRSPTIGTSIHAGAAILAAANLAFMSWRWSRARPGSADADVFPLLIVLHVTLLINWVPGLLWPDAERLRLVASAFSIMFSAGALIWVLRRNRELRRRSESAPRQSSE